jgi:hypothetical protein
MVCLYETTLSIIREIRLEKHENDDWIYTDWNWLGHELMFFIYKLDDYGAPFIPKTDGVCRWSIWFNKVMKAMQKIFHDATRERVFRVLENPPHESITTIAFEATPLKLQLAFKKKMEKEVKHKSEPELYSQDPFSELV